jgi:hypothetical protein
MEQKGEIMRQHAAEFNTGTQFAVFLCVCNEAPNLMRPQSSNRALVDYYKNKKWYELW